MKKILFVNHDITPYVAETELSTMGRMVPHRMQQKGSEIRTFMPRWGNINERRGQLHEVIRLSGLNIAIKEIAHPLIIKVASIPATKVQVYFIDNEDFFTRRGQTADADGNEYTDNGERAVFFARGVIETFKKLRWVPEVIHCQGWMSSLVPLYIKASYKDDPIFANVKVVTSLFEEQPKNTLEPDFKECVKFNGVNNKLLSAYNDTFDALELAKLAIDYSDGVIMASENVDGKIADYARSSKAKVLEYVGEDFADKYAEFYPTLFE